MRAGEFIVETRDSARPAGKLKTVYDVANPGAITGSDIDRYYDLYRAGMLMGKAPDDLSKIDPASWINNQPYFGAYTEVDKDKILAAFKALNITPKTLIEPGSKEHPDVQTKSPMNAFKGYPR